MNLQELNKNYENYMNTEEFYLEEGLKLFKLSKKLFRYSNHLEKKANSIQMKKDYGDLRITKSDINKIKRHAKKAEKIGKEIQEVEKDFKLKDIKRKEAKEKIKKIRDNNSEFFKDLRNSSFVKLLKEIGDAAIVMGVIAAVTGGISPLLLLTPGIRAGYFVKDAI